MGKVEDEELEAHDGCPSVPRVGLTDHMNVGGLKGQEFRQTDKRIYIYIYLRYEFHRVWNSESLS